MNKFKSFFMNHWNRTVVLSLLLLFSAVPHTLEDFFLGEPAKNGIPYPLLAIVVGILFTLQGLALYQLGQRNRSAYFINTVLGLFWALAAGKAQLPVILTFQPYRAGWISLLLVGGIILAGILLSLASILALKSGSSNDQ